MNRFSGESLLIAPLSKFFLLAALGVAAIGLSGGAATAGVMLPAPDIWVSSANVMYNGVSDQFLVMGNAATLEYPESTVQNLYYGNGMNVAARMTLNATIDENGDLAGGTFNIVGSTMKVGPTVSLLSGTLTDLQEAAFTSAGKLEFSAVVASNPNPGQGFYDIFGPEVVLSFGNLGAGNSFTSSFMVAGFATADVGRPVPEPASFALWAVGAPLLTLRRRRANDKR